MYGRPERYSPASDIFDLGCLFSYVLFGFHPFGDDAERQVNINKNFFRLPQDYNSDPTSITLINKMISFNATGRPTADEILADPFLGKKPLNTVPHLTKSALIGSGSNGTEVYEYICNGITVAVKKIEKSQDVDYHKEIQVLQNRLTMQSPHLLHYYSHVEDSDYW